MASVPSNPHRTNWLLASLEADDFAFLEPHLTLLDLSKREVLYEPGDPVRYTYFPHSAIVCLVNLMEDGRAVEVASFGREGMLGFLSALASREAFGRYVVQIPGLASRIPFNRLQEAVNERPRLRRLIIGYTEALLTQTFIMSSCNAVHTVEARCCNWILSTQDRIDEEAVPLTHADFAELLGVQRSSVSVVLRTLQTAGLIQQQRGGIVITDRAGLEEVSCECYGRIRESFAKLLPVRFS
jgi:CRP-like cAMP-binding protein